MNDFYRKKAAVPRQAKSAETFSDALLSLVESRWDGVTRACDGLDDGFRIKFGEYHSEYSGLVRNCVKSVSSDGDLHILISKVLGQISNDFSGSSGAGRDASGLCGAELEVIIKIWNQND